MATAHIIHAFLGFTSTRLGFEVSCPRTLPRKNPEDQVRLEPRTPGLQVKHFTTEPHWTQLLKKGLCNNQSTHGGTSEFVKPHQVNSLPNDKILDLLKKVAPKLTFALGRVENIVGKGENDYQHFFLFPLCFQKITFSA